MYEVILLVCAFANPYTTELVCKQQTLSELPACSVTITHSRLYHPDDNPTGDMFIKSVECKKMIPVAPAPQPGVEPA